jgi:hypothetical protein
MEALGESVPSATLNINWLASEGRLSQKHYVGGIARRRYTVVEDGFLV